jgi:hypothetical protein
MSYMEQLWSRAREIESQLPIQKREAFAELKCRFPQIQYGSFGRLAQGFRQGRLDANLASVVASYVTKLDELEAEARQCRIDGDRLRDEALAADKRKRLDPAVDPIPAGEYPKLRACRVYPLRQSCNYGENAKAKWDRCEFMKYDNSRSILDPARWYCAAPK